VVSVSLTRYDSAEVRLSDLQKMPVDSIDLLALKQAGVVHANALTVKVILCGELTTRAVKLQGLLATKVRVQQSKRPAAASPSRLVREHS